MAAPGRRLAQEMKRDVRILQNKLADLSFFTEDFRENSLQINARVMANLDIFNIEFKQMTANKRKIESLETKVDGLQTTIQNLLSFLGIEERQRQVVLFVSHRGAAAVPNMRDVEVQVAADVDQVEVEKKNAIVQTKVTQSRDAIVQTKVTQSRDAIVQTKVTQSRDTGIQCCSTSADASVQTVPMAAPNVEAGLGATAADIPKEQDITEKFPPPLPRMLTRQGSTDYPPYPNMLCSPAGDLQWTLDGNQSTQFKNMITKNEALSILSPAIILPTFLQGLLAQLHLHKTIDSSLLSISIALWNNPYNTEVMQLPFTLGLAIYFFQTNARVPPAIGNGRTSIDETANNFKLFDIDIHLFNAAETGKLDFQFYK